MARGKSTDDNDTSKDGVVIQRVIHEVGSGSSYPALTKTNYSDWGLLMKVKLKARALWSIIEDGRADQHEEMMVLDALCSIVPPEMVPTIEKEGDGQGGMGHNRDHEGGDDCVKKATVQQLR
jgi:hypothetical protein